MRRTELNEEEVLKDFEAGLGCKAIAEKHHVGGIRIVAVLDKYGIKHRKRGAQPLNRPYVVKDWNIKKYPEENGYYYEAITKDGSYTTKDYMNAGGFLTSYIKKTYGIEIPTLHDRQEYYKMTGDYWWEQWFDIEKKKCKETKKCPYCDWETVDVTNKCGVFGHHLLKAHNKTIGDYLKEHPEDSDYFPIYMAKQKRLKDMENDYNHVVCPLCGKKYMKLSTYHITHYHNISIEEFRRRYPDSKFECQRLVDLDKERLCSYNLIVNKDRFVSKFEKQIQSWLDEWGIEHECNRQILIGKEIDILVPSKKIGIEFDGLKFHTEFFGKKTPQYHVDKTNKCNEKGYALIHIFEDEIVNSEEIVKNKLKHILGVQEDLPRVYARKKNFEIKEIYKHDAQEFLSNNHIQGFSSSSVYIGGFWDGELVAVMTMKKGNVKNPNWELTRFATSPKYIYCGVAGKMFMHFVREYNPSFVVSFADRRWTLWKDNNLYTKLGFELEKITRPDYSYYNERVDKYKRIHKMTMSKQALHNKYGFPLTMTEREMTKELGYDRIWNCGLFKYVWKNKNLTEK